MPVGKITQALLILATQGHQQAQQQGGTFLADSNLDLSRKRAMGRKVIAAAGGDVRGRRVGLLGLTFKPNTDDMRDAPSLAIVHALLDGGAIVTAFDPEGMVIARTMMPEIGYANDAYEAAKGADVVVIITEWDAFRALDLKRLGDIMKTRCIVDLRNTYKPDVARSAGFTYHSSGGSTDRTCQSGSPAARARSSNVASAFGSVR